MQSHCSEGITCEQAYRRWVESPNYTPVSRDHVLAAGRAYDRYLKTAGPLDYVMRFLEDGSVYLHAHAFPDNSTLLSLDDIMGESRDFWTAPWRVLWQHILAAWE